MPESQYRAREVSAKTQEVLDYHHDESQPGKPLFLLIPGGLIALGALGVIILIAYKTWIQQTFDQSTAFVLIGLLAPFYVGGVFLFSYGYELYNFPRALRLTAIIVFLTFAAVVIIAVLFVVLGMGGKLPGSASGDRKKSSGKVQAAPRNPTASSGGGFGIPPLGPVIMMGGPGRTRTVTRDVERKVEVPVAPRSIDCPYCGRSYVPAEQKYACPACGAATPKELIEQSEAPKNISDQ